jgi:outer membrane protein OmpA-like peptidoglycan-associated protein
MTIFINSKSQETEDHWISISDIMAGLMMIFLFIAIVYMVEIDKDMVSIKKNKEDLVAIAENYLNLKERIYKDLLNEFNDDFQDWRATLDRKTLSIRFLEHKIYFKQNSNKIEPAFNKTLNEFFPRYIDILYSKYQNDIEEIRIEGHTSSEWFYQTDPDIAYINNMKLSQERTRSVLQHVLNLRKVINKKKWLKKHLTANGLSSSRLIITNEIEDKEASRRVEFRVEINAEKKIEEIIDQSRI